MSAFIYSPDKIFLRNPTFNEIIIICLINFIRCDVICTRYLQPIRSGIKQYCCLSVLKYIHFNNRSVLTSDYSSPLTAFNSSTSIIGNIFCSQNFCHVRDGTSSRLTRVSLHISVNDFYHNLMVPRGRTSEKTPQGRSDSFTAYVSLYSNKCFHVKIAFQQTLILLY